mmetsp:Transcript_27304/g.31197  ORF Transcript_27304/g.31197 Transcript_27304/m.31197 type:complete len:236 (+) Transcript_27304:281-988(+)
MTETAQFNVGGIVYQVSRSLLQSHPDTMLAKSASDQWQEDPESEIFIERNGFRFQFVLDYLRDGCKCLPITESKIDFIKELEYYNIKVNADKIENDKMQKANWLKLQEFVQSVRAESKKFQLDVICAEIAIYVMKKILGDYFEKCFTSSNYAPHNSISNEYSLYASDSNEKECFAKCEQIRDQIQQDPTLIYQKVNTYLNEVRLELSYIIIKDTTKKYYVYIFKVKDLEFQDTAN